MIHILLPTCFLLLAGLAQAQDRPLLDQATLIEEFRRTLITPQKLLSQYTYVYKETEITLDSKNNPRKTETNVYHVIHGAEDWQTYERQITKDGVPLTEKELEKQDRKEQERIQKEKAKRAKWSEEKKQQEKAKAEREQWESSDDIFKSFDFHIAGREPLNGVSSILVNFKPKKTYNPKTSEARMLQHVAGRLWISEDDHQLARFEGEVIEPIKIGAGLLAKLQPGSTFAIELQKINGEIWLPVKADVVVNGRLLLLRGINMRIALEFSDHKKFNVDTTLEFKEVVQ